MTKHNHTARRVDGKHVRELRQLAAQLGIYENWVEQRGKHYMLCGHYRGRRVRVSVSTTPSDVRAQHNFRAQLRREMRAIDAKPTPVSL